MDKDTQKVLVEARRQGFTVKLTRKGHAQVRDAEGQVVAVFSGTASDRRALDNGLARLKRVGFVWPPRKR